MRAGDLRHRIVLQSRAQGKAADGEATKTFSTYATVWAKIEPQRGAEVITAQEQKGQITHKITVRYNTSIALTDQIVFKGRTFEINSMPDYQERKVFQELVCTEVI